MIFENDFDFGLSENDVVCYWCDKVGIWYLGCVDIGYDIDNKIVLFGKFLDCFVLWYLWNLKILFILIWII